MPAELSIVEGQYLRDILDQPGALQSTIAALESSARLEDLADRLNRGNFKAVVLTGMGSSFHGLHPLQLELIERGFIAARVETSELVHYEAKLLSEDILIIAASQSGESAELIRLLEVNRSRSPVIAVTNTAGSRLAQQADASIVTQAGKEFSVSCKTYVAALAALRWLTGILCQQDLQRIRGELEQTVPAVQNYLSRWRDHVSELARLLQGVKALFLVGRGPSLATVGTGALIIKESDRFPAEGMSSAAFRHGPFEMLSQEILVAVFSGQDRTRELNRRLAEDIGQQGGRAELVGEDARLPALKLPVVEAGLLPILEILPVQMLTVALAAQAGREAGRFERATKITTTE